MYLAGYVISKAYQHLRFWLVVIAILIPFHVAAEEVPAAPQMKNSSSLQLPVVPVGLDAIVQWDRWPYQRYGTRTYMRGTYDRQGGNRAADASHFLYQDKEKFNVVLDVQGSGTLYWARFNHWHGSPWHFEIDGRDNIVKELGTRAPEFPTKRTHWVPRTSFPDPLAVVWTKSQGADLSWVPIEFSRSLRIAYSRTHYGTGCFIYQQYLPGIPLSHEIGSWSLSDEPSTEAIEVLNRAGSDLVPQQDDPRSAGLRDFHGSINLPALETTEVVTLQNAPATVRALEFSVPRKYALAAGRLRLKITWDAATQPSIDAPLALFYGSGTLYNRDDREFLVKSLPMTIRFTKERVNLSCYFPMPYFVSARIELENPEHVELPDVSWRIRTLPFHDPANYVGYFHANYVDIPKPEEGHALQLLDTREVEGGGDWSGQLVGNSVIYTHEAVESTLEGDPRFWLDDSRTPQEHGGGTEEWGGGGSYWRGGKFVTLPLVGHPVGVPRGKKPKNSEDKVHSFYRFLLSDLMPFGKRAQVALEHGSINDSHEHYEAVTYWYGIPSPSLILTDQLDIGSTASERSHSYFSPEATRPYTIESRFEWGVHQVDDKIFFPAQKQKCRTTTGTSEFVLKLDPTNFGVMLRRTLDYAWPNQCAEVFIADADASSSSTTDNPNWKSAGKWYTAGSDIYVFSSPPGERDHSIPEVLASDRRFRDDEFLIARRLTEGRSSIRVKLQFEPVNHPLLRGYPQKESAWSEIRYSAYSYVMPHLSFQ
jgi:hypothetical protein